MVSLKLMLTKLLACYIDVTSKISTKNKKLRLDAGESITHLGK
jgi:hypothetical protein